MKAVRGSIEADEGREGELVLKIDLLIHSAKQLVTCASDGKPKRGAAMADVGIIEYGAVAIHDGKIIDVGGMIDLQEKYTPENQINASGRVVCPGFIDPHTHVVYAGERIDEFEMRIQGKTYMEIMAAGGGIVKTMEAIRAASVGQLVEESHPRLDAMLRLGTTTVEVKSGYGLDTAHELMMLQAAAILDDFHPVDIVPTFLGAHAVPPEYKGQTDAYVALVIGKMIPRISGWYEETHFAENGIPLFVDVFCEAGAFNLKQMHRILEAGKASGMLIKAHVDEFTSLGGVTLAVEMGATSVDHLDVTTRTEINILAQSDTVGVVIPAVNFNLGSVDFADARGMIDAGAAIALCTDINPGSAPCPSMPLVMAIACRYQRLLPAEAMNAATINAAYAIGMGDRIGSIEVGKQADLLVMDVPDYRYAAYEFGVNPVKMVFKYGERV
jgi:imidazolonepropionase